MLTKLIRVVILGDGMGRTRREDLHFFLFCLNYFIRKGSKWTFVLHDSVTSDKWLHYSEPQWPHL